MMLFMPAKGVDLSIDNDTAKELLAKYTGLIRKIASKVHSKYYLDRFSISYDDLVLMGETLLIYAWKKYDPQRGYMFSTFLYRCLSNAYGKLIRGIMGEKHTINFSELGGGSLTSASYHTKTFFLTEKHCPLKDNSMATLSERQSLVDIALKQLLQEKHLSADDIQIYKLRASGKKLAEIGEIFELTYQRIDQKLHNILGKVTRRVNVLVKE